MAIQLEPTGDSESPRKFGQAKYPWQDWTNGQPWYVKQGEDYTASNESFTVMLYQHAKRKGLRVIQKRDYVYDGVIFQFYQPDQKTPILPSLSNERAKADPDTPRCHICGDILKPLSIEYGECVRRNEGDEIPGLYLKHNNEKVSR